MKRGWWSLLERGEEDVFWRDIELVKEGQRSIENVGFPTEIEIDRDVQRKRKF